MRQEIESGEMERTDEQVQHDVGDDDVERAKVDKRAGIVATVRLPVAVLVWCAERSLYLQNQSSKTHTQHGEPRKQSRTSLKGISRSWSATYCHVININHEK